MSFRNKEQGLFCNRPTERHHTSLDYLMLGRKPDLDLVRDQVEELLEQVLQLQKML